MGPNELLLWLSARQAGSWSQFRSMVEDLGLDEPVNGGGMELPVHQRLRLNLQSLGHVDFLGASASDAWRVTPPVLAIGNPGGRIGGVLCGARSQPLLARLTASVPSGCIETIPMRDGPDCIRVRPPGGAGEMVGIIGVVPMTVQPDAVLNLLSWVDPVDEAALGPERAMPFGRDVSVERFVVERKRCRWEEWPANETGSYDAILFRCTRWQTREHFLRINGRSFATTGQTAKFFILQKLRRGILRYDAARLELRVPAICRPPMLVDRALSLCSGLPPAEEQRRGARTLVYADVSPAIAGIVAELLRQPLI
jgi:hypothetical protein